MANTTAKSGACARVVFATDHRAGEQGEQVSKVSEYMCEYILPMYLAKTLFAITSYENYGEKWRMTMTAGAGAGLVSRSVGRCWYAVRQPKAGVAGWPRNFIRE